MAAPIELKLLDRDPISDAYTFAYEKFTQFKWAWYDGVETKPNVLDPVDFAMTIAMNSRATAGRMAEFMKHKAGIEERLREVPTGVRLDQNTPDPIFTAVRDLFVEACKPIGTKLSVASKVLHRKRPELIPILDSVIVDQHYWPLLNKWKSPTAPSKKPVAAPPNWFAAENPWMDKDTDDAWADPTLYMRAMADELELDGNRAALKQLRIALESAPELGIPKDAVISDVRLFEATLYTYLVRSEA